MEMIDRVRNRTGSEFNIFADVARSNSCLEYVSNLGMAASQSSIKQLIAFTRKR